jgi:hypothetical protein
MNELIGLQSNRRRVCWGTLFGFWVVQKSIGCFFIFLLLPRSGFHKALTLLTHDSTPNFSKIIVLEDAEPSTRHFLGPTLLFLKKVKFHYFLKLKINLIFSQIRSR